MSKIRIIGSSEAKSSIEHVIFTNDFNSPADEFILSFETIDYDEIIEDNLPSGFPRNFSLEKER